MQVQLQWASGMRFVGKNADGVGVVMDGHPEPGAAAGGPSPMETLLFSLAGCTAMDVIPILQKMRAPVERFSIDVVADRAETHPKVLTAIHLRFWAAGPGLQTDQVERAVTLSQEKYCAISAMLRHAAPVTYDVKVTDTGRALQPSPARAVGGAA